MTDLARRLSAHPRWEWRPGMAALCRVQGDDRVFRVRVPCLTTDGSGLPRSGVPPLPWHLRGELAGGEWDGGTVGLTVSERSVLAPDLADPATQGCLLALLREAGPHGVEVSHFGDTLWSVTMLDFHADVLATAAGRTTYDAVRLGAALASALLAAWGEADHD